MTFLKNALEGLFILYDDPKKSRKEILNNIKFIFPLPMFFLWAGFGLHIMMDNAWMNKNISDSQPLLLLFGISFCLTSYPVFFKFIYPLLEPDSIDRTRKSEKIISLILYWAGCFILLALLGWLTNFTRADEFRQTF